MIEIKSRWDGRVLYTAKDAQDVRQAVLGAVEAGANLAGAYLAGANLAGANLAGAYLTRAKGLNPWRMDDLRILLDQVGKIRAYKLVDGEYRSPIQSSGRLTYKLGETLVEVYRPLAVTPFDRVGTVRVEP